MSHVSLICLGAILAAGQLQTSTATLIFQNLAREIARNQAIHLIKNYPDLLVEVLQQMQMQQAMLQQQQQQQQLQQQQLQQLPINNQQGLITTNGGQQTWLPLTQGIFRPAQQVNETQEPAAAQRPAGPAEPNKEDLAKVTRRL